MEGQFVRNVVEAALLAAARPLSVQQLAELFEERERPPVEEIRAALASLGQDYTGRGIELKEVASGYRIQIRRSMTDWVSRLWQERPARYSRALLETLALIAYRQPITRAEIEEVRGVAVNPNIVRTLFERNWIRVVGHREVPGRPELLGTTREFLDYFGLASLDELPTLAALRDMDNVGVQLELAGDGAGQSASPEALRDEATLSAGEIASPEYSTASSTAAEDAADDEVEDDEPGPQSESSPGLVALPEEPGDEDVLRS